MAIRYEIEKHAVAFPSKLLAQNGGKHIYNVVLSTDTDNGNLIARGEWDSLDLYKETVVTTFEGVVREQAANGNWYVEVTDPGDALFVYQQPVIAEEWTNTFKKTSNFFNAAGDRVRSYELAVGDVFEVSAEGFSKVPTKGAKIQSVTNKKMVLN